MKPLNTQERATALWKFVLIYTIALAIPITASWFLFSDNTLAEENGKLKRVLEEQTELLSQMDTLTRQLQRLDMNDRQMRMESNDLVLGELTKRNQDHMNTIAMTLSEVRVDSLTMKSPVNKRIANNLLRDFDLFRNNRSTIDFLRQQLTNQGIDVKDKEQVSVELAEARQQLAVYQACCVSKPSSGSAQPSRASARPAGKAADSPQLQVELQDSREQIAQLNDQIAFNNADCIRMRADDKSKNQRKEMFEQARKEFLTIFHSTQNADLKESARLKVEYIDKKLNEKRGIFR